MYINLSLDCILEMKESGNQTFIVNLDKSNISVRRL